MGFRQQIGALTLIASRRSTQVSSKPQKKKWRSIKRFQFACRNDHQSSTVLRPTTNIHSSQMLHENSLTICNGALNEHYSRLASNMNLSKLFNFSDKRNVYFRQCCVSVWTQSERTEKTVVTLRRRMQMKTRRQGRRDGGTDAAIDFVILLMFSGTPLYGRRIFYCVSRKFIRRW